MKPPNRNSISSRLTSRGWSVLIFIIFGIAIGRTFGIFTILILSICALVLFLFSLFSRRRLSKIKVECKFHSFRVPYYGEAHFSIKLEKSNRGFSIIEIQNITRDEETINSLLKSGMQTIEGSFETHKRGPVVLGPLELITTDTFGLVRSKKITNARATLLVHPFLFDLESLPSNIKSLGTLKKSATLNEEKEFYMLRDYQVGDNFKNIHWKSSAKTGTMLLKQFETQVSEGFSISLFIDNRPGLSKDVFEEMISTVASIANAHEQNGKRVFIQTTSGEKVQTENYKILDFLSLLNQTDVLNAPLLTNGSIECLREINTDLTLIFLGTLSKEDEKQLANMPNLSNKLKLFFFDNQIASKYESTFIEKGESFSKYWENF